MNSRRQAGIVDDCNSFWQRPFDMHRTVWRNLKDIQSYEKTLSIWILYIPPCWNSKSSSGSELWRCSILPLRQAGLGRGRSCDAWDGWGWRTQTCITHACTWTGRWRARSASTRCGSSVRSLGSRRRCSPCRGIYISPHSTFDESSCVSQSCLGRLSKTCSLHNDKWVIWHFHPISAAASGSKINLMHFWQLLRRK